jgi:ATP-binding cassette subfamily B protein
VATCRGSTISRGSSAVDRAGAADVVERLIEGLDTQLGPTWPGGVEVSFGQWQKLALARGFMRDRPLLLVLDEPTAALDAETEHAVRALRRSGARRLRQRQPLHDPDGASPSSYRTVSHRSHGRSHRRARRFEAGRIGSHEALMAKGGQYAELYGIQAAAYR